MKSKTRKMGIDILMTVFLFILMAYHYTGQMWHEITGTTMFVLFICHHVMNREWYLTIGKGKYPAGRIFLTVMNLLLTVDVLLLMLSGIAMSNYVFRFLPVHGVASFARRFHMTAAYLGFLLMSFHIGLHMGSVFGKLGKKLREQAEKKRGFSFLRTVLLFVICVVGIYGIYALNKRNFLGYISGSTMFAFFDYAELPVYFFLDYAAILIFGIMAAFLIQKILTGGFKGMAGRAANHFVEHKKRYLIFAAVLVVVCILFFLFGGLTYIRRHYQTVSVNRTKATQTEQVDMNGKKGIIIYFTRVGNTDFKENVDAVSSASLMEENGTLIGNSELLAEMLENATGYPSYAIRTKKKYSSSYGDTVSEAKKEMDENTPSELENDIPELSDYDTVILVYPLWWGTLPMPVQTFLEENDMNGKTIYSLVTHGGSGFGSAIQDTGKYTKAEVSSENLSVYDDEAAVALPKVLAWVKRIADR